MFLLPSRDATLGVFPNIMRMDRVVQVGCNAKLQGVTSVVGMVMIHSTPCPLRFAGWTAILMCKRRSKPTVLDWKLRLTLSTRKGIYNVGFAAVAVKSAHIFNDLKMLTIS